MELAEGFRPPYDDDFESRLPTLEEGPWVNPKAHPMAQSFCRAPLDGFQGSLFPRTEGIQRLMTTLDRQSLVVLSPRVDDQEVLEKRELACYLAARWVDSQGPQAVLEWTPRGGGRHLIQALRELEHPSTILLHDIQPLDAQEDLSMLAECAATRGHKLIAWTLRSPKDWKPLDQVYLCCPARDEVYPPHLLSEIRQHCLDELGSPLITKIENQLGDGELEERFNLLTSPQQMREFSSRLLTCEPLEGEDLQQQLTLLIDDLDGDKARLRAWYLCLSRSDQQLLLGLLLFHGLFDDQVLAGTEHLITACWRDRDPRHVHYDYTDLYRVGFHFRGDTARKGPARLWARESYLRTFFELSWELHRRQIVASLPHLSELAVRALRYGAPGRTQPLVRIPRPAETTAEFPGIPSKWTRLYDMARQGLKVAQGTKEDETIDAERLLALESSEAEIDSLTLSGIERELFGSPDRSVRLQATLAMTIAGIGHVSIDAVEPSLRSLATESESAAQDLVSWVLADWIRPREETIHLRERSLRLLGNWADAAQAETSVLGDEDKVHMQSTVARTLAHVAGGEAANSLEPFLFDRVRDLLHENNPTVRRAISEVLLPSVCHYHPKQMAPLIGEVVVGDAGWIPGAAKGFAVALEQLPGTVFPLLDTWRQRAAEAPKAESIRLLTLEATILGCAQPQTARHRLQSSQIYERLRSLLDGEVRPEVRSAVFSAALIQLLHPVEHGPDQVKYFLEAEARVPDRRKFINDLAVVYLQQREWLRGGTPYRIRKTRYHLWVNSERPLTGIEEILFRWLGDEEYPVGQQIAVEACAQFEQSPPDRTERLLRIRRRLLALIRRPRVPQVVQKLDKRRVFRLPVWQRAVWGRLSEGRRILPMLAQAARLSGARRIALAQRIRRIKTPLSAEWRSAFLSAEWLHRYRWVLLISILAFYWLLE